MAVSNNFKTNLRLPRKFHINDRIGRFDQMVSPRFEGNSEIKELVDEVQKAFDQLAEENRQNWLEMERFIRDLQANDIREITASYFGTPTIATSPPYRPNSNIVVGEFVLHLGTAGTASTTVDLKKNGTTVSTVTLTSSATTASSGPLSVPFTADSDILTFAITAVGSGASNLTAIARFV